MRTSGSAQESFHRYAACAKMVCTKISGADPDLRSRSEAVNIRGGWEEYVGL